jgi:hypothetical protein
MMLGKIMITKICLPLFGEALNIIAFMSMNRIAKPFTSFQIKIDLISSTKIEKGSRVNAVFNDKNYPKIRIISEDEINKINILRNEFHGVWSFEINICKVYFVTITLIHIR